MNHAPNPLRAWREKNGLSLRQMAGRLAPFGPGAALSYASLGRIEKGLQPPPFQFLLAVLELSAGEIRLDDWVPPDLAARVAAARAKPAGERYAAAKPGELAGAAR